MVDRLKNIQRILNSFVKHISLVSYKDLLFDIMKISKYYYDKSELEVAVLRGKNISIFSVIVVERFKKRFEIMDHHSLTFLVWLLFCQRF